MSKNASPKAKWIESSLALVRAACADDASDTDKRHGAAACRALLETIAGIELPAPPSNTETQKDSAAPKATPEIAAAELVTPPAAALPAPPAPTPTPAPTKPADLVASLIDRYAHLIPAEERPRPLTIPMAPIPTLRRA